MATTFVDGTTPLDASAMNGIESEISELESTMNTQLSRKIAMNYSSYTNINNETDLNNITSYGNYVCTQSASAAQIDNNPVSNYAFFLIVMQGIGTNNIAQFIFAYNGSSAYWRTYSSSAWNNWKSL